jgi:hypothetical protein
MLAGERRSTKRRTVSASEWLYVTCCSTRARVWLMMVVVWCIVAFFSGLVWSAIHFLLLLRHPPWAYVLLASAPPALASAGVVWVLLAAWNARHEAVEQRQADLHEHVSTLIHLNERVRNALQAIAYASYAPSEREMFQARVGGLHRTGIARRLHARGIAATARSAAQKAGGINKQTGSLDSCHSQPDEKIPVESLFPLASLQDWRAGS